MIKPYNNIFFYVTVKLYINIYDLFSFSKEMNKVKNKK